MKSTPMSDWQFCGSIRLSTSDNNVGIPLYRNRTSNGLFIPETDDNLHIIGFCHFIEYELYDIDYFCAVDFQGFTCQIGDPVIIPFWQLGHSHAVWGDIDLAELQQKYPEPNDGPDFLDTIRRLVANKVLIALEIEPLDEHGSSADLSKISGSPPINTKYWINRFKFISGRAPNTPALPEKQIEAVRSLAIAWLKEWHHKGSFELALDLMGNGHEGYLTRSEVEHVAFAQYMTRRISGRGRAISKKELTISRRRFFSKGLLHFVRTSYRPAAHIELLSQIQLDAPSYDHAVEGIEQDFRRSFFKMAEGGNIEDLLQLCILVYGDYSLPRDIEDYISHIIHRSESTFFHRYNQISYSTPRNEKDHYDLYLKSTDIAHLAWDIELFNRILRSEARVLGRNDSRIDRELIENLQRLAERHLMLSRI